jgi:hypothetical protein
MKNFTISFDAGDAVKYGMLEAILIRHFTYWINKNRMDGRNYYDGRTWSYTKVQAIADYLRFATYSQVRRAIDNLCEQGVLVKGSYNENTYDRTSWYAFAEEDGYLTAPRSDDSDLTDAVAKSDNSNSEPAQMSFAESDKSLVKDKASNKATDKASADRTKKVFKKPTLEEVEQYFYERCEESALFTREATKFFDYYESKGWVVGKSPMKNWQAAVRNWIGNLDWWRPDNKASPPLPNGKKFVV